MDLVTDYLVVGCGETEMSFVDELIHKSTDLHVIIVDRRAKPGGHWVDAYSFVRPHLPAAFYGVNSHPFANGEGDLPSKAQFLDYYKLVMEDLVATGRVSYYPQCEFQGDGRIISLVEDELHYKVRRACKT